MAARVPSEGLAHFTPEARSLGSNLSKSTVASFIHLFIHSSTYWHLLYNSERNKQDLRHGPPFIYLFIFKFL